MTAVRTGVLVLAAGRGRRFGTDPKQVAIADGRALVAAVIETAIEAEVQEVVVVVGHAETAVRDAVPAYPTVRVVVNTDWDEGISTSVRRGLRALSATVDVAVVLLADQPDVTAAAVGAVATAAADGPGIARARHLDGPSHPVALARSVWAAAAALRGDEGARQLFGSHAVREVHLPGPRPVDIDRPGDLARRRRSDGKV